MTLFGKACALLAVMIGALISMTATVANGAPIPGAEELAHASSSQLLAWAVVVEAGVIVALSGVIVQAYRNRVRALEKQVEACRNCAVREATQGAR